MNPAVDTLVAKAEALPFGAARNAVYARIQRILVDDVAAVPLFYRLRFNLDGPHVGSLGWTPAYSLQRVGLRPAAVAPHEHGGRGMAAVRLYGSNVLGVIVAGRFVPSVTRG